MREKLIQYVNLLFAGTGGTDDIRLEILQNTLDRFDDLIAQGKSPEAAYSLAISGIGDISEILRNYGTPYPTAAPANTPPKTSAAAPQWKKYLRAAGIFLYIICAIPLLILSELGMDTLGLCATVAIAAVATAMVILSADSTKVKPEKKTTPAEAFTPQQELYRAIKKAVNTSGLIVYFALSFFSGAWHITWLIFPIEAAVCGLIKACMDLKEVQTNER